MTGAPAPLPPPPAPARAARRRGRLTVFGRAGVVILVLWVVIAVVGPFVLPLGENDLPFPDDYGSFQAPRPGAWLGTDVQDRDVLTRIVYGASRTLGISVLATMLGFLVGVVFGVGSALIGGMVDVVVARFNDAMISLPTIMLGLIAIAAFGSSIPVLILITGFLFAPIAFRLSRALGMEAMTQDYVEAARLRGEGLWWVIRAEIWPNIWLPLLSEFGIRLIYVILFIASLSFLGLGIQPPRADWGSMVRENIAALQFGASAMPVLAPAFAIASVTMAINFIVDDFTNSAGRRRAVRR
jgi:peptide/nickel transport system permease protein